MDDRKFMDMAIMKAREGMGMGQTPFGACMVRDGKVIACQHNRVWENTDITAHAEIAAIREACEALGTVDLSGSVIYSTTEPCPMCFSAIHWARIDRIIFGTRIADAREAGFSELTISNREMKERGNSQVEIIPDFMRGENLELFREFGRKTDKRLY